MSGNSDKKFDQVERYLDSADIGRKFSDAAKRASDAINGKLTWSRDAVQKWMAFRLSDGDTDGVLYDTKLDAIRHQLTETQCMYVCLPPTGTSPAQMETYLDLHRRLYDQGARLVDPDDQQGGRQYIPPVQLEDLARQQRALRLPYTGMSRGRRRPR